jgi:hypothetical protein
MVAPLGNSSVGMKFSNEKFGLEIKKVIYTSFKAFHFPYIRVLAVFVTIIDCPFLSTL